MNKTSSFFIKLGYIWVILPVIIFFAGYCNTITTVLGIILTLLASFFLYKNAPKLWIPNSKKEIWLLIVIGLVSLLWVYLSGIGAYVYQNPDHTCRNPIFEMMVSQNWPVLSENGNGILTYYIGFWFVPALVGKIFNSINIGYFAQLIWASIGVFLTFYYILCALKKKSILPVIIFIFFSGMDVVGVLFSKHHLVDYGIINHLEWWAGYYQFSSMTTQLFWVFNQAIPAWIITMLIYHQKDNKSILLLYTSMFISSTLPAMGLCPFIAYFMFKNGEDDIKQMVKKENILNSIKNAFSIQNLIGLLIIFPVSYIYLSGNVSGGKSEYFVPSLYYLVTLLFPFLILEAGLFMTLIYKLNSKNPIYYICLFAFLYYPFIYIGNGADFCMRATIPALILLYLMIVKTLENDEFKKKKIVYIFLVISLCIGAVTPFNEITRTVLKTFIGIKKAEPDLSFDNFFAYKENNKFLKYFGKNIKY